MLACWKPCWKNQHRPASFPCWSMLVSAGGPAWWSCSTSKVPLIVLAYQHSLAGEVADGADHQHTSTSCSPTSNYQHHMLVLVRWSPASQAFKANFTPPHTRQYEIGCRHIPCWSPSPHDAGDRIPARKHNICWSMLFFFSSRESLGSTPKLAYCFCWHSCKPVVSLYEKIIQCLPVREAKTGVSLLMKLKHIWACVRS